MRRSVREVGAGTLVLVRPGERVAVDGIVVEGCSSVDEAVITGESQPLTKASGSVVLAGSHNYDGTLVIQRTGPGTAPRQAQNARRVRAAMAPPRPTQTLADPKTPQ